MKKLIRKILKEETNNKFIDKVIKHLEPPYFKNMESFGLIPDEYESTLSKIFNQPVIIRGNYVYNEQGNLIYLEDDDGYWDKREYDDQGNLIYHEDSNGYWEKYEYDDLGNEIYYENRSGYWVKKEYDDNGNEIYYEDSSGRVIDGRYE